MATKTQKKSTKSTKLKTLAYESLMNTEKEMTIVQTENTTLDTLLPDGCQLFVRLTDGQIIRYSNNEITKYANAETCNNQLGIDLEHNILTHESLSNNGNEVRRVITELFNDKNNDNLQECYVIEPEDDEQVDHIDAEEGELDEF